MNITYTRPGELRKPDIDVLPDGRIRITRYVAAGHGDRDNGEVTEAIGTQDSGLTTALLVKRAMGVENGKPAIIKTYEVRSASDETQVGLPDVSYGDNGLRTVVQDFVQMSTGTYTPGTVGTTTAPTDAGCVLQQEQMQDDGTTRQIRRVYISKGLISQSDDIKNNGALLLKTLVYLNDAPSPNPPTGYTLVSTQVASPNGLETTTYTFAKGTGKISQDDETKNNGALLIRTIRQLSVPSVSTNPISTPSGYTLVSENYAEQDGYRIWSASYAQGTGQISQDDETKNNGALLVRTIRYLSVPSVSSNPIGTPAGYTLVSQNYVEQDGHKVWSASYVQGTGQISQDDETKSNGNLLVRTIRYLTTPSVSSNPISTPSGYTLVSQNFAEQDGYRIWSASYAKGTGQISQDDETRNNGSLLIRSIRYLTIPSVSSNPIATPAGYTLVSQNYAEQDGYRIWTASYANGTGKISQDDQTRNNGSLLVSSIRYLSIPSVSTNPITTPSGYTLTSQSYADQDGHRVWTASYAQGTGQLNLDTRFSQSTDGGTTGVTVYSISYLSVPSVSSNPITTPASTVKIVENYQDQDGYRIWNATYAKGAGVINVSTDTRSGGKLIAYHKVGLGSVPSTPTATIGGTVSLISSDTRNADGYVVYDYRWVEAYGVIHKVTRDVGNGLRMETWTSFGQTSYDAGYMQPVGVLMSRDFELNDGYVTWVVVCMQNSLGQSPTSTGSVTSLELINPGGIWYTSIPAIQFTGGGGSGATATAILSGGTVGYVTGATVNLQGSNYTSPPTVSVYPYDANAPTFLAILSNNVLRREKYYNFTYPGRAQAVSITNPNNGSWINLDSQLSPPIEALILGTEETTYYANDAYLSNLPYPVWNPTEWATLFAQYITANEYGVSRVEGLRGYRTIGGVSTVSTSGGSWPGARSILGQPMNTGTTGYLKIFGGPDAPDNNTYVLDVQSDLAFTAYDGTQYFRRIVGYATIPPQATMPTLSSVTIVSTSVTNTTTLKAVGTVGVAIGARTNGFSYTWTQSGVTFIRTVTPVLTAGTLTSDTTFLIKPTDYNASTNAKYWTLC